MMQNGRIKPRLEIRRGRIKTVRIKTGPWRDVTLQKLSADWTREILLSAVVSGTCFAEPDTFSVFEGCFGVFREGTRLVMPKTICAPDSSSLKPGLGATEGVRDLGVFG